MRFEDIRVGMIMTDDLLFGERYVVDQILKTRVKIKNCLDENPLTYDKAHCQFLKLVARSSN